MKFFCTILVATWLTFTSTASARCRHDTVEDFHALLRLGDGAGFGGSYHFDLCDDAFDPVRIGFGASIAFPFVETESAPNIRDFLITADVVRLTWYTDEPFHLITAIGGYFVDLPAQMAAPTTFLFEDGTTATTRAVYSRDWRFGPVVTVGVLYEHFMFGSRYDSERRTANPDAGVSVRLVAHARLDDYARVPPVWLELSLGIRFGSGT